MSSRRSRYPLSTPHPYVSESPEATMAIGMPYRSFPIVFTGFILDSSW
ncbi:MAG: hypothetical protein PHY29_01550 [Syntrophales bacterium]|nr:hypothetical protein [Syntrophales bacterium]